MLYEKDTGQREAATGLSREIGHRTYEAAADDKDDWRNLALCAQTDPELFFPKEGGSPRKAQRVCMACEVRQECLTDALENSDYDNYGVRGGLTSAQRRRLKKQQREGILPTTD